MKRLVEQTHPRGTVERRAAKLSGSVGPTQVEPRLKHRIRERLLRTPLDVSRPRRFLRVRLSTAAALLGLATASAAAATWFVAVQATHDVGVRPPPTQAPVVVDEHAPPPTPIEIVPSVFPTIEEAPSSSAPTTAPPRKKPEGPSPEPGSEAGMLFDATRALRHEGNPNEAHRILSEYQRKFPGGTLSEEALALSVEIAQRRGDPRAKQLAARYLERYPSGHFRSRAQRVLDATP
jgi:hypothetical protein